MPFLGNNSIEIGVIKKLNPSYIPKLHAFSERKHLTRLTHAEGENISNYYSTGFFLQNKLYKNARSGEKILYSANFSAEKKSCKTPCQKRKIVQSTFPEKKNRTKHHLRKEKLYQALSEKIFMQGKIMTIPPAD